MSLAALQDRVNSLVWVPQGRNPTPEEQLDDLVKPAAAENIDINKPSTEFLQRHNLDGKHAFSIAFTPEAYSTALENCLPMGDLAFTLPPQCHACYNGPLDDRPYETAQLDGKPAVFSPHAEVILAVLSTYLALRPQ